MERLPVPVKQAGIVLTRAMRQPTARWRRLPDFLVIGTMRGGSTSLYHYLAEHPQVRRPLYKEIEYFTLYHDRGQNWYRAHFPFANWRDDKPESQSLAFDDNPNLLLAPRAAWRAAALIPQAKIIAMLRDPVARAFSHYQLMVAKGHESLSFEGALAAEPERMAGQLEWILSGEADMTLPYRRYSYFARGVYVEQVKRWTTAFPSEQVLILRSEDLYENAPETFARVLDFLELPSFQPAKFAIHGSRFTGSSGRHEIKPETRSELAERFRPYNEQLYELLGRDFGW